MRVTSPVPLMLCVTWLMLSVGLAAAAHEPLCEPPDCRYEGAPSGDHIFNLIGNASLVLSWEAGEYLAVQCQRGEPLDAPAVPRLRPELAVRRVTFQGCAAPRRGWGGALRALGVAPPPPRLQLMGLPRDTLVTGEQLAALPGLRALRLQAARDAPARLAPDALRHLTELTHLTATDVRVRTEGLPVGLREVTLSDAETPDAGWGAARPALERLRLAGDVRDASGLSGAAGLRVLELSGPPTRALWSGALPRLENATLRRVTVAPAGLWAGCELLRAVSVVESRAVTALPAGWLAGRARLDALHLQALSLTSLPGDVLRGAAALRRLAVLDCGVTSLPGDLLRDATDLRELVLDHNKLTTLPVGLVSGLRRLERVSVAHNLLTSLSWLPARLPALAHLDAQRNPLGDTCGGEEGEGGDVAVNGVSALRRLTALRRVSLSGTGARRVCADWRLQLVSLDYLDLSYNNITILDANDLTWIRVRAPAGGGAGGGAGDARVDLSHNPLEEVQYSRGDYLASRDELNSTTAPAGWRGTVLDVSGSRLRCDCRVYWLVLALQAGGSPRAVELRGAACRGGVPLRALRAAELECALPADECPASCACSVRASAPRDTRAACSALSEQLVRWRGGALHVTLEGAALTRVPHLDTAPRALRLARNDISTVALADLPPDLQELDLSNNTLVSVEAAVVTSPRGPRTLRLAGNPLRCDCDAAPLLAALLDHADRVADYEAVRCADGRGARAAAAAQLCGARVALQGAGAALLVLAAGGAAAALLYARYRHLVKAFLHTRAPPCCCARDSDEEEDARQWDVFVSYSHEDAAWVEQWLVPRLEAGPGPARYRVCVHVRDWVAGDWIPAQIARSVRASRRTLAVLSPAYLRSAWARAELRAALAAGRAGRRGGGRLVALLLREVPPELLREEPDLQAHLNTNTYLRADDPWFWDKLRLALPRRPLGPAAPPPGGPAPPPPGGPSTEPPEKP